MSLPDSRMHKTAGPSERQDGVLFSFLTPTRNRPDLVARLFQSIIDTTTHPDRLEIVLAVDRDDEASLAISDDRLNVKRIVLKERLTMGQLNNACFEASSGRYIMLMNDDVILRTKGWDDIIESVFRGWGDDIGLVHVNDLLFRERLCTFPMLSRKACAAIGLCPDAYRRYKIDDHIYDTYSMLAHIGHKRIAWLPDVVFEHENHEAQPAPEARHTFAAGKDKVYVPKQAIIERDDETYLSSIDDRKADALKLASILQDEARARERERTGRINLGRLASITREEPYRYRHPSFVTTVAGEAGERQTNGRTTVAVVTADLRGEFAERCIALVKEHTSHYDLMVLDNNHGRDFNHAREMNKVLATATTDFVVLIDDDVFVEKGWLDGMLKCIDDHTAAVTPVHKDADGNVTYTGIVLAGDGCGTHVHTIDVPDGPRPAQCHCSACLLIDRRKVGHIRMDEMYRKYFFDLVHSLDVWEAGYRTALAPDVAVTHLGGATTIRGSETSDALWSRDRDLFMGQWLRTGRLDALASGIWQDDPYTRFFATVPARIKRLLRHGSEPPLDDMKRELSELLVVAGEYPIFERTIEIRLMSYLVNAAQRGDAERFGLALNVLTLVKRNTGRADEMLIVHAAIMRKDLPAFGERVLSAAVMLMPEDPVVWKRLGANKFTLGDLDASRNALERALSLDADDAHTLVNLAKVCMQQADYENAYTHFRGAARHNPTDADAHVGVAVLAHHFNDEAVLKTAYRRARELAPGHQALKDIKRERPALVAAV